MKKLKTFLTVIFMLMTFCAFAQEKTRDVPYTKELLVLIDSYFNHDIESKEHCQKLYDTAIEKCPETFDEYQKETHISRCDYYFGLYIIETYDLTELEHALDDTTVEYVDPVERNRRIKAEAQVYFDNSMAHAQKAMNMHGANSPDAMVIYTQSLSANCTVRSTSYVLGHGLKIGATAKKALKADPLNATGCFSLHAQDVYAPGIFGNANRGRKMMMSYLENEELVGEKFDKFNFTCAIAYTYYRQNKFEEAKVWYNKCLELFPKNYAVTDLVKKCDAKLNH